MKKLSLIILFVLMAFSCKNSIDNKNTKKGYGVISFTSSARTVQENFNVETLTDICLFGKNEEESDVVSLKSWDKYENFLSDSLSIAVGSYKFYITAKIGNVRFESDVVSVDIAESSINIINFKVYVTDRGTGKGTVELKFRFGDLESSIPVSHGSFELNKITYGNNTRKKETVDLSDDALVVTPFNYDTEAAASATFIADLDPGVYELISRFEILDEGVAVYPVTIHVSEGQTSSDVIEVLNFNPYYDITYYDGETPIAGLNNTYYPTKYSIYDEVEFPRYEKSYYEFEGWYTDSSFTNKIETIDKYEFAEDLSLYAKWKLDESQYLLFNQSEAFNVVMQDNVANKEQLGKYIYSDFTIGGGDFFYYLSDNSLKKSNDDDFSEQAYFQEGQVVFPIDMLYYEYGADKIHGLSIDDEINNDYHSYYDFKNKKQLYFDYSYDTKLGMIQDFAVSSNTLYLLYFGTDRDSQTNYFIHVYDIREDAIKDISGFKCCSPKLFIPLFNDINDTDLHNYFIKDMIVVEGKLYILWNYYSAECKSEYDSASPAKVQCYGGVLCYDPDGNTLTELINGGNSIPPEAQEIEITKPNHSSDAHFNYFGPAEREEESGIYDITYLFGPTKFIAIKPKKLVFADEGIFVYNDENNNAKYKNVNRVIEIDLETKEISQLSTDATFNFDKNDVISVYSDYNSITLDSFSSEQ